MKTGFLLEIHFLIRTYIKQSVDQLDEIVAALAQQKNVWNPLIRLRFVLYLSKKIHFRCPILTQKSKLGTLLVYILVR